MIYINLATNLTKSSQIILNCTKSLSLEEGKRKTSTERKREAHADNHLDVFISDMHVI